MSKQARPNADAPAIDGSIDEGFLDAMASLMTPWGWPRQVGRMYGYLLLQEKPVTLDQLAVDLRIAKSNASVAARTLEIFGNARRQSEPGSKRISYSAPGNQAGPFGARVALLRELVTLLDDDCRDRPAIVTERLRLMAEFYRDMAAAMQSVIDGKRT